MDADDQLALRRDAMLRGLKRARTAIPRVAELDPALGERLDLRFGQLAGEVEDGFAAGPDARSSAALLRQGEDLIAETLAFVGGAAARSYGLDEGITSLALEWLDRLSVAAGLPKIGVVIPATTEFTGMLTQVVRLKLPTDGIWGLPVAVHEFGHFVASVLQRRENGAGIPETVVPVERLLHAAGAETERPRLYWHGHELFADALAAAVTGSAYSEYCLRYRFAAAEAHEATPTHPSPARRLRIQLAVLDSLAAADVNGLLVGEVDALRKRWGDRLAEAGQPSDVPPDELLDPLERELLDLVLGGASQLNSIRYGEHEIAQVLAESQLAGPQKNMSVAHVLNAAWHERRRIERDGANTVERVRQLADRATTRIAEALDDG
jgi:hypothetical protein